MRQGIQRMVMYWLIFSALTAHAQHIDKRKSVEPTKIDFKSTIQIDGKLSDWGDSLPYYFDKQELKYALANDEGHIYVAMQVPDGAWQMQALHQGFSFTVNTDGKKKEGASVYFPLPDRESLRALATKDKEEKPADIRKSILGAVRGIYVKGLTDVVDGFISLENNYGIRAIAAIDSNNTLCYEAVIPFERLGIYTIEAKDMAFNIKINGIVMRTVGGGRAMNRYGYGGYGYGYPYGAYGMQPTRKEAQQEPGVWLVLPLAKPK
ncbi:hypothetical protein GCM10023231_35690 [Olivibacter ginsenosidimutans]|uniref:Uncharacterized protein n=2 Tax=Olivibacter ginsenosidimutans TaxID=1176537 RepID=A0ABP9C6C2_9SPHI